MGATYTLIPTPQDPQSIANIFHSEDICTTASSHLTERALEFFGQTKDRGATQYPQKIKQGLTMPAGTRDVAAKVTVQETRHFKKSSSSGAQASVLAVRDAASRLYDGLPRLQSALATVSTCDFNV